MKTGLKKSNQLRVLPLLLMAALLFSGCGKEPADPYAGMVQVESGFGTKMWVELYEELPENPFAAERFTPEADLPKEGWMPEHGIDVSEHQQSIDWSAVATAEDAPDFAVIRAGYRGYSAGGLYTDAFFTDNMTGAIAAKIPIGVYFFSQALSPDEAREEAEYVLELLKPYGPDALSLPVFYDWESINGDDARTDDVDAALLTDCAVTFCETVAAAGYTPGVYAYRFLAYFDYDLSAVSNYALWISANNTYPDFYYAHTFWQYSFSGSVAGINGDVDLNLRLPPVESSSEDADPAGDS